jgi:hypothetical protein
VVVGNCRLVLVLECPAATGMTCRWGWPLLLLLRAAIRLPAAASAAFLKLPLIAAGISSGSLLWCRRQVATLDTSTIKACS